MARAAAAPAGGAAVRRKDFFDALRALCRATGAEVDGETEAAIADTWRRVAAGGEAVEPRAAARFFECYLEALRRQVGGDAFRVACSVGGSVLDVARGRFLPPSSVVPPLGRILPSEAVA